MSDEKHVFRFLVYVIISYKLKRSNFVVIKQTAVTKVRIQACQSTHKIFVEYALQRHRQPL